MIAQIAEIGLLEDEEIELDLAALALSALDHVGVDLTSHLALVQAVGSRIAATAPAARGPREQAAALAQIIGDEFDFTGDVASYDAPLNADLIRVLDRRRGLPVALAILYVAAARRVGWQAWPLNIPGHVLVRVGDPACVLIDPFHRGGIVSEGQLRGLLQRTLGSDADIKAEHVPALSNRATLVRLLMNQATRAEQGGDNGRARTVYERMTVIAPDHADGWWDLARAQMRDNALEDARASLSAMLEVTRDPARRELVTATLDAIAAR